MGPISRSILVSALVLTTGSIALAKKGGGGGSKMPAAAPAPAPQVNTQLTADRKELSAANSALVKAQKDLDDATNKLLVDFEKTPDYVAAKKTADDATSAADTARTAALENLKTDPTYTAAVAAEKKARDVLDRLRTENATHDVIADQSTEVFKAGQVVSKLERATLDKDPNYLSAQTKLADANKTLLDLRNKFKDSLKTDETIAPLRTARDDAQKKVHDAEAKVASDTPHQATGSY